MQFQKVRVLFEKVHVLFEKVRIQAIKLRKREFDSLEKTGQFN